MNTDFVIETDGLTKRYGHRAAIVATRCDIGRLSRRSSPCRHSASTSYRRAAPGIQRYRLLKVTVWSRVACGHP